MPNHRDIHPATKHIHPLRTGPYDLWIYGDPDIHGIDRQVYRDQGFGNPEGAIEAAKIHAAKNPNWQVLVVDMGAKPAYCNSHIAWVRNGIVKMENTDPTVRAF